MNDKSLSGEMAIIDQSEGGIFYVEHGCPSELIRWHSHEHYELHLIVNTTGKVFIGDYVGRYQPGQLILTGPNVPHNWITDNDTYGDVALRDMVILFNHDSIEKLVQAFPEAQELMTTLDLSHAGVEFVDFDSGLAQSMFSQFRDAKGTDKLIHFLSLLTKVSRWENKKKLSTVKMSLSMSGAAENKINETCELVENIIEQGKKVIVFTNFTDTLNRITDHFGKKAVKLDGKMSKIARQNSVDQFQENDKIKVFVGNLKAAGVGITLTAAEAVVMNDLSFVPSDHSQAEDRAYRYGQKSNVSVFYPIFENSIEGIIYDILSNKKNIFETVMGDNEDRGDIMEQIINEISVRR